MMYDLYCMFHLAPVNRPNQGLFLMLFSSFLVSTITINAQIFSANLVAIE